MRRSILVLGGLLLAAAAFAATPADPRQEPPAPSQASATPPRERPISYAWDLIDHSVVRPPTRILDPALLVRNLTGNRRQAENVDADDQVRLPSTWWQPRLGFRPVTVDQMLRGAEGAGPPVGTHWTITKAKTEGVTPGFQIEDQRGAKFFIKFDSKASPELGTSVDVIGSHLFWAAGYNVPENHIAYFRAESLTIGKEATYTNENGHKSPFTPDYLAHLLSKVARQRDGRYRVVASRFLEGKPLGPFEYSGRRRDDPEDRIPHELRRELRGLWIIAAWTNHCDSRAANTLDTWVTAGGRSFVRHHLLDFSAILGAGPGKPRSPVSGTEYYVDPLVMAKQAVRLGLAPFPWEAAAIPLSKSVGLVDAATFDGRHWKPDYANPAFDERSSRDVRWGARIVAAFTDEHIRAAVLRAQYSDPRATEYIIRVLIERRDKIAHAWLGAPPAGTAAR
jgi:hypothetical protein